jgi:hypothetical protein
VPRWKERWQKNWNALKRAQPGTRFEAAYDRQRKHDQGRSKLVRWVRPVLALVSFAVGVVLAFIPGPAVVFFALSAALVATQSLRVARFLDRAEIWLRDRWGRFRRRRSSGRPRPVGS